MASLPDSPRQVARHIARRTRKSPGFFAAAVVTLALGIGANAAMFSVVYAVLLKPLPFDHSDRLVAVLNTAPGIGWKRCTLCAATYFTYREENRVFEDLAIFVRRPATVAGRHEPEQVTTLQVTEAFLPLLRIRPLLGRGFTREDVAPGSPLHVMITYGYWQRQFAGDPHIVGRGLTVDGMPRKIIGVLPKEPALVEPFYGGGGYMPALLVPLQLDRATTTIMNFTYVGVARLKTGATVEDANRDVARVIPLTTRKFQMFPALAPTWFQDARIGPDVHFLSQEVTGKVGRVLWILMGTIAIVFLIACANVANLFLVRAEGRQQELAVRAALGATRGQLARTLLSESLGLGLAGGVVAIGLAAAAIRVVRATAPAALPRVNEIALHPAVLVFAGLLSVAAGLLFGLIPTLKFASPRLAALRDGGRSASESRDRHRTRSVLVVAEIALALVLLVASGLMIRSFLALRSVDPGFTHGEQLLTFGLSIPPSPDAEATVRRELEVLNRIRQVPGVQSAAVTTSVSLDGSGTSNPFLVEEFPQQQQQAPLTRRMRWVSPEYFRTMGTPLLAGRNFTWNEVFSRAPVMLINDRLARIYWKTPLDAVGKRARESAAGPWREIIGVVASTRDDGIGQEAPPMWYVPVMVKGFFGGPVSTQSTLVCVVRSPRTGSPAFLGEIRQAVWSVDKSVPLANLRTMEQLAARSMAQTSFALVMVAIAAGVALLLGVVGIYGVIAYITAQRTREVGIRMALGAEPGDVARLFLRHALALAGAGIVLGVGAALGLSRLMTSLLFGVSATDLMTYALVSSGLAAVALLASYLPSRRAARMHPVAALRLDG